MGDPGSIWMHHAHHDNGHMLTQSLSGAIDDIKSGMCSTSLIPTHEANTDQCTRSANALRGRLKLSK